MTILCSLQNLNLAFGQKVIFDNAKLTINQGDRIGLIGLNGHGKSTLFNILAGKVTPDISQPPFIFDKNKDKFKLFYIPQELLIESFDDLEVSNFWLSFYPELLKIHRDLKVVEEKLIEDYTDDKLLNKQSDLLDKYERLGGWDIENNYTSYLNLFELENKETQIKNLSGGEQRKIALSIGLSAKAEFILWDEPTNHLDVSTIELFEDELQNSNKTYMIISHDRYLLNHVTDRIVHIERGQITSFKGTYIEYLEYLEEKEKELAKNLDKLENRHRRELAWMRQGIKARGTRSKKRVEGFENIKSNIQELKSKAKKVINLDLAHSGRKTKVLVEIKEGEFSYSDSPLLENLNLVISKKDKVALIGPNGTGKSTLLKIISGQLKLKTGSIKTPEHFKVITFDQKRESLDLTKTPFEVVGDGQDFVHLAGGQKKHVISYLENYLFSRDQVHRPIETLSGGEKNRLQLAMFMRHDADLWIFDEPTNDLDIETIELLEKELAAYDAPVIIVGHDRAFIDNVCKSTWLVHDKSIELFEGGYSQVAPYLHALEIEQKSLQETPKTTPNPDSKNKENSQNELSFKEKKRLETIEKDIQRIEEVISELERQVSELDFSKNDPKTTDTYNTLKSQIESNKASLEAIFNEWEELEKKQT